MFLFLVNNVGKQYTYPMYLAEIPEQELWDIININTGAATIMTRMIMPQMKARGRGAIVNVSSSSELQPLPLMAVYAATKVRCQMLVWRVIVTITKKKISLLQRNKYNQACKQ